MKRWCGFIIALALTACSRGGDGTHVTERIALAPATFALQAEGSLKSAKATPLIVPGEQWSQRQLNWMLPDGSGVKEGDTIARFSAEQSKLQLATALVDLQRNALARAAKQDELGDVQGKLEVDLSQVVGLLGIAHRYAHATEGALARNTILDAVQDEHFLGVKQGTLNWRKDLSSERGHAELALIDAQRATNDVLAKQRRADLEALELHAPHAGLLVLEADWSGEKPRIGASMWAGNNFASLPDIANMEVEISMPQTEAQGVKEGLVVELAPLGAPDQKVVSKISWVAAAAAARSRESPVKYLSMKASMPADAITRYHWAPGQRFAAHIVLLQAEQTLSVPNIAVESSGDATSVTVRSGDRDEKRSVRLGVRGPSRSQVLEGLKPGDIIVLDATARSEADKLAATAPSTPSAKKATP
jgi:HlyD family secretion protein